MVSEPPRCAQSKCTRRETVPLPVTLRTKFKDTRKQHSIHERILDPLVGRREGTKPAETYPGRLASPDRKVAQRGIWTSIIDNGFKWQLSVRSQCGQGHANIHQRRTPGGPILWQIQNITTYLHVKIMGWFGRSRQEMILTYEFVWQNFINTSLILSFLCIFQFIKYKDYQEFSIFQWTFTQSKKYLAPKFVF